MVDNSVDQWVVQSAEWMAELMAEWLVDPLVAS